MIPAFEIRDYECLIDAIGSNGYVRISIDSNNHPKLYFEIRTYNREIQKWKADRFLYDNKLLFHSIKTRSSKKNQIHFGKN
jgi:hypothetical protein